MGTAPAEWMPLRSADDYAERKIELLLNSRVQSLDVKRAACSSTVATNGFDALLLATGADPVRLDTPVGGCAAVLLAQFRRLASDRRGCRVGEARRGGGREFHRTGGGRIIAAPRHRGARRRPRARSI